MSWMAARTFRDFVSSADEWLQSTTHFKNSLLEYTDFTQIQREGVYEAEKPVEVVTKRHEDIRLIRMRKA